MCPKIESRMRSVDATKRDERKIYISLNRRCRLVPNAAAVRCLSSVDTWESVWIDCSDCVGLMQCEWINLRMGIPFSTVNGREQQTNCMTMSGESETPLIPVHCSGRTIFTNGNKWHPYRESHRELDVDGSGRSPMMKFKTYRHTAAMAGPRL